MLSTYSGNNAGRGPSGAIWGKCDVLGMIEDPNKGFHFFEDFLNAPVFASATSQNGFITYQDTGVTIKGLATEVGGVLQIAGADADNDEGSIQTGGGNAGMVKFNSSAPKKIWFETRIRVSSVDQVSIFAGLAEEGAAAANLMVDDTGVLVTTKDFVGFRTLVASPAAIDAVYQKGSQTLSTSADVDTLVADTWVKLGFYFNGSELKFYIDGELVRTVSDISLTTFPDGEELAPLVALKASVASEKKLDIDWIRVASEA